MGLDTPLGRRHLLTPGVGSVAGAWLKPRFSQGAPQSCAPPIPQNHAVANGGSCPYPIPWLDKNVAWGICTVIWTTTDQPVKYEDAMRQFRFEGHVSVAQLEATIRVPEIGFTFTTDPLATSKCDFAVMGNEVNGKYYPVAP